MQHDYRTRLMWRIHGSALKTGQLKDDAIYHANVPCGASVTISETGGGHYGNRVRLDGGGGLENRGGWKEVLTKRGVDRKGISPPPCSALPHPFHFPHLATQQHLHLFPSTTTIVQSAQPTHRHHATTDPTRQTTVQVSSKVLASPPSESPRIACSRPRRSPTSASRPAPNYRLLLAVYGRRKTLGAVIASGTGVRAGDVAGLGLREHDHCAVGLSRCEPNRVKAAPTSRKKKSLGGWDLRPTFDTSLVFFLRRTSDSSQACLHG